MGIEENNKELIRYLYELYNQHDVDAASEIRSPSSFDENFTWEQNKQMDIMLVNAYPDLQFRILDMIAEGDKVAFTRTMMGTHTGGPIWGIPATGKKVEQKATLIGRIADNKIVELDGAQELLKSLQQLGILPTIPEAIQAYKESHNLE
jgi:predicted ester cyclase